MMHKCECPYEGVNQDEGGAPDSFYHPTLELPFRKHAPGQCRCTNNLRQFHRATGATLWLCSLCKMPGDEAIS